MEGTERKRNSEKERVCVEVAVQQQQMYNILLPTQAEEYVRI